MKVTEFMTPNVITVLVDSKFADALQLMINKKVNHLPVVNNNREMVGIISSYDALNSYNNLLSSDEKNRSAISDRIVTVQDVMSTRLISMKSSQCAKKAVSIFKEKSIHAIPIVDDKKLIGIVTAHDILDHLKDELCPCSKLKKVI